MSAKTPNQETPPRRRGCAEAQLRKLSTFNFQLSTLRKTTPSFFGEEVVQLSLGRLPEVLPQCRAAVVFPAADLFEDLGQLLRGFLGVEAHHADGGAFVEDGGQDGAVPDEGQLDVVAFSLVEEHRELLLA